MEVKLVTQNLLSGYQIAEIENGYILTYPKRPGCYPEGKFFANLPELMAFMSSWIVKEHEENKKI